MEGIKHKLAALMALAAFLMTPGLALAADAAPKTGAWTAETIIVSRPQSWTGFYVGAGAGWEVQQLEGETGFKVSDQAPLGYARLGYRFQQGRFVVGAFVEGNASAMDIEDEIKATYAALLGAEAGMAIGSVLVGFEAGFKRAWLDAGSIDLPTDGLFFGPSISVDLGDGIEAAFKYRWDATEGETGGYEIDKTSGVGLVGVAVRF